MKKDMLKKFGSLLILAVVTMLAVGSTDDEASTEEVKNAKPAFTITAQELFKEYESNEVSADTKYKEKVVQVSGTVSDIGKDILDNPYVVVGSFGDLGLGVQCTFAESQNATISELKKGDAVSIKGTCNGSLMHVQLNSCVLIK